MAKNDSNSRIKAAIFGEDPSDGEDSVDTTASEGSDTQDVAPKLEIELVNGGAILHIQDFNSPVTTDSVKKQAKTVVTSMDDVLAQVKKYLTKYAQFGE
jgi:hypothetical protein